jgi:hypothetical protein
MSEHNRKMERALTSCFLFHYVDSLLARTVTAKVIVMPHISDNIWYTGIKYSQCFTTEIRTVSIYNSKRQGACSGYMYWLHRIMGELSHCCKNERYVCLPLLFNLLVRYCLIFFCIVYDRLLLNKKV